MGRNQSVGKIGKDGSQAPAIDLYRRQVISTWSLTVTMDFFFLFQNKYISLGEFHAWDNCTSIGIKSYFRK